MYDLFTVETQKNKPMTVDLTLNGVPVCDDGSRYTGAQVVGGAGPNLLGRDWLSAFEATLNGLIMHTSDLSQPLKGVLDKYATVFKSDLGCLQGEKVHLFVDERVTPKFCKPCSVPLAMKESVEAELDRLESTGIISPVKFAKWAAPIVPVPQKDGTMRICGDFKTTVNRTLKTESYPLPRVELFVKLSGGKSFTKLDMSNAYLQLPLDEESSQLVTINTHKGLFKYNRLPFGVSSAPAIFQRCMESLLREQKGAAVYIGDILVTDLLRSTYKTSTLCWISWSLPTYCPGVSSFSLEWSILAT